MSIFASWPMNAGEIERWEWNICFENISAGGHRLFWYTHIAHLHLCTWQHTACPQKIPEYRQKMKSTFLSLSMIGPNASTPSLPHKASWLFAEKGNWLENMAALVYKACVLGVWHCTEIVYNYIGLQCIYNHYQQAIYHQQFNDRVNKIFYCFIMNSHKVTWIMDTPKFIITRYNR